MPEPFGPDEPDVLAALEREGRGCQQLLVARADLERRRLDDGAAAAGGLQEVESERAAPPGEELQLAGRAGPLLLQALDLRQLRLGLLGLALLVPEALDEALQARDVHADPLRGLGGRRRPRRLLDPPGVPGAREEEGAAGLELEHARRDRLQEPAVVRDEDDGGVERLELLLEPLEVLDVEVVRRLVQEQQVGITGEGARQGGAGQLAAGEGLERPVEVRAPRNRALAASAAARSRQV